jgi:hypothetical protein
VAELDRLKLLSERLLLDEQDAADLLSVMTAVAASRQGVAA